MSHAKFTKYHGALALMGPSVDALARSHLALLPPNVPLQSEFHITLLTKAELRSFSVRSGKLHRDVQSSLSAFNSDARGIVPLGVGGNTHVFFVVIAWADGARMRRLLGIPPKEFHITLTLANDHSLDKSIRAVTARLADPLSSTSEELALESLFVSLSSSDHAAPGARDAALALVHHHPDSARAWARLAAWSLAAGQPKAAMLSWARVLVLTEQQAQENERLRSSALKHLLRCARQTEWGTLSAELEHEQVAALCERSEALHPSSSSTLSSHIFAPWPPSLRELVASSSPGESFSLALPSRERLLLPDGYVLPRFFRWVVPFRLAASSTPRSAEDVRRLAQLGVSLVVTLTEETPLPEGWFSGVEGIRNVFFPVRNYEPPSIEQMDDILDLIRSEPGVTLVHCGGGKGRAGTVLAVYLSLFHYQPPPPLSPEPPTPVLSAQASITLLRRMRPGSLETAQQEAFVSTYLKLAWHRFNNPPSAASVEPEGGTYELQGAWNAGTDKADLIMLVGLPGSGKSWFARALASRSPAQYIHLSQDDAGGSRSAIEAAVGHAAAASSAKHRTILLDRANVTSSDRAAFLALAFNPSRALAVFFDYAPELCEARVKRRRGHSTLPPARAAAAVRSFAKALEPPEVKEGFKAVFRVRSRDQTRVLIRALGKAGELPFFRFPRTSHLLNLGSATRDDLVWSAADVEVKLPCSPGNRPSTVVIQEKVDGANIGLSLSPSLEILVQNRSHYVHSSSATQFKHLLNWLSRHSAALTRILSGLTLPPSSSSPKSSTHATNNPDDSLFPDRLILFGEWLSATHSIAYTSLPDRFLAFDLYDRHAGRFVSRERLAQALEGSGLSLVPVLYEGITLPARAELEHMATHGTSKFVEGRLEGVVVRWEADGWVRERAKIVRPDFIAGDEHWGKRAVRWNGVVMQSEDV